MKIITCEQVSAGHPDKICDQIADAIVTDVLRHHNDARVAIEYLAKDEHIIIAGELTSTYEPDYNALIYEVLESLLFAGTLIIKKDYCRIFLIFTFKSFGL
jgi:S-adenosylmethionine synthetase